MPSTAPRNPVATRSTSDPQTFSCQDRALGLALPRAGARPRSSCIITQAGLGDVQHNDKHAGTFRGRLPSHRKPGGRVSADRRVHPGARPGHRSRARRGPGRARTDRPRALPGLRRDAHPCVHNLRAAGPEAPRAPARGLGAGPEPPHERPADEPSRPGQTGVDAHPRPARLPHREHDTQAPHTGATDSSKPSSWSLKANPFPQHGRTGTTAERRLPTGGRH